MYVDVYVDVSHTYACTYSRARAHRPELCAALDPQVSTSMIERFARGFPENFKQYVGQERVEQRLLSGLTAAGVRDLETRTLMARDLRALLFDVSMQAQAVRGRVKQWHPSERSQKARTKSAITATEALAASDLCRGKRTLPAAAVRLLHELRTFLDQFVHDEVGGSQPRKPRNFFDVARGTFETSAAHVYDTYATNGQCGREALSTALSALGVGHIDTEAIFSAGGDKTPSYGELAAVASLHNVSMVDCRRPEAADAIGCNIYEAPGGIPYNVLQQQDGVFILGLSLKYNDGHPSDVHAIVYDAQNAWEHQRGTIVHKGVGILIDNDKSGSGHKARPFCFVEDSDRPTIAQVGKREARRAAASLFQSYFPAAQVTVEHVYLLRRMDNPDACPPPP